MASAAAVIFPTVGALSDCARASAFVQQIVGVSRADTVARGSRSAVQRLEADRRAGAAGPAGRRSPRATPDPTSRPSADTPSRRSRHARPQLAEHRARRRPAARPAPTAAPAHSWCAARPDGRSTPAADRPARRRTPRCPPRPRTPVGPALRPGRRRDARGSSSATARRTPAVTAGRGRSGQSSRPSVGPRNRRTQHRNGHRRRQHPHMSSSARRLPGFAMPRRQAVDGQVTVEKAPCFTV